MRLSMSLLLLKNSMTWNSLLIPGFLVWLVQLTIADLFIIDTVRPDFIDLNHVLPFLMDDLQAQYLGWFLD